MKYTALIAGVALASGLGSVVAADDPVVFDNLLPNGGFGLAFPDPASQLDTAYPFDSGTADDFVLGPSGGPDDRWRVTGVRWWGGFFNPDDAVVEDLDFMITIWPDAGGTPAGATDAGNPPDYDVALGRYWIEGNANQSGPDGQDIFEYSAQLPGDGFLADPGTTYWLEIQAVFPFEPQWAWQATMGGQGAEAVFGFDILGEKYWTDPAGTVDVAFQLSGRPVPGPGAMAMLAVAAVLSGSRRRRR